MKEVSIYTDGACSGNPGAGGWAAILIYKGVEKEISGGEKNTTNNRMELMGAIKALQELREPCAVQLYSDSKYLVDAMKLGWAKRWKSKGWMRAKNEPAKNPELWETLLELCEKHQVEFNWVRGHASNQYNNRCDQMAVAQWKKLK